MRKEVGVELGVKTGDPSLGMEVIIERRGPAMLEEAGNQPILPKCSDEAIDTVSGGKKEAYVWGPDLAGTRDGVSTW